MESGQQGSTRLEFVDNLRALMIVLVVSMHACDTYSPFGNWYYKASPPVSFATAITFATYQSFQQAFFMGLLFFISGFFASQSVHRPTFIRDRLLRLGAPTLLYAILIGPLTEFYLSHTWGTDTIPHEWLKHVMSGEILSETGPMWFALALLIFSLLYALWSAILPTPLIRPSTKPSRVGIVLLIALLTLSTFLVRLAFPEDTSLLNFHLGDFAQYIVLFCLGITAHKRGWLDSVTSAQSNSVVWACLTIAAVLWVLLILFGGALRGDTAAYNGGFNLVSLAKCTWESLVCVGMLYLLSVSLRAHLNHSNRITRLATRNSFAVYVFHPPIVVSSALALRALEAPALAKAAILTIAGCAVSFTIAEGILRRIPLLRAIL